MEQTIKQKMMEVASQLVKLKQHIPFIEKTVILYDFFDPPNQTPSINLNIFARFLLDNSITVNATQQKIKKNLFLTSYSLSKEQPMITIKQYWIPIGRNGASTVSNYKICIYDNPTGLRIVALPFNNEYIYHSAIKKQIDQLQQFKKKQIQKFREIGLKGAEQSAAIKQMNLKIEQDQSKLAEPEKNKILEMFCIEASLSILLEKTSQVSICSLAEHGTPQNCIPKFDKQFKATFSVPKNISPQLILYNYSKQEGPDLQADNKAVSVLLANLQGKVAVIRNCLANDKLFTKQKNIRTNMYLNCSDIQPSNQALNQMAQLWGRMVIQTSNFLSTTVKPTLQIFGEGLNVQVGSPLQQILDKYFPKDCCLLTTETNRLNSFLNANRISLFNLSKQQALVPDNVKSILFAHCLQEISKSFLLYYKDIDFRLQTNKLLDSWSSVLKELFELISSLSQYQPQKIQKYFNCLIFQFEIVKLIKSATNQDTGITTILKQMLEKLVPSKGSLASYLLKNQSLILKNQPINYYNILLLIIRKRRQENLDLRGDKNKSGTTNNSNNSKSEINVSNQGSNSNINSGSNINGGSNSNKDNKIDVRQQLRDLAMECYLLQLKAQRLTSQYIDDNGKLVQAAKIYAWICLKYPQINTQHRQSLNLLLIKKQMAGLLSILDLQQPAAQIYLANGLVQSAHRCWSLAQIAYTSDSKANKLIEWGTLLQSQSEYSMALDYYRRAYQCAEKLEVSQKALGCKLNCLQSSRKGVNEGILRKFQQTLTEESRSTDKLCAQKLQRLYQRLLNSLSWDSSVGQTIIKQQPADGQVQSPVSPSKGVASSPKAY